MKHDKGLKIAVPALVAALVMGAAIPVFAKGGVNSTTTEEASASGVVPTYYTAVLGTTTKPTTSSHNTNKSTLRTLQGNVKQKSSNAFVFTVGTSDYDVSISTTTKVINRSRKAIPFSTIRVGDNVRVYGKVNGLTIPALVVRDVTLPATTTSPRR